MFFVGGEEREIFQDVEHDLEPQTVRRSDGSSTSRKADLSPCPSPCGQPSRRSADTGWRGEWIAPRCPDFERHADRAEAIGLAFGGEGEDVGYEQRGDVDFVVVLNLRRAIDPRDGRAHGCFAFADDERQAVDEQNKIGPTRLAGPR